MEKNQWSKKVDKILKINQGNMKKCSLVYFNFLLFRSIYFLVILHFFIQNSVMVQCATPLKRDVQMLFILQYDRTNFRWGITKKYKLEYAYHDLSDFCCSLDTKMEVIDRRPKNDIEMTLPCQRIKVD